MARKMLAGRGHPGFMHTGHNTTGQLDNHLRISTEGAVSNNTALTPVQIQHRGKADIDIKPAKFCRHQPAKFMGTGDRMMRVL